MRLRLCALCGFKKVNHKIETERNNKDLVCCDSPFVPSVVSKKVTTERTKKNICRSSLMQLHLCALCGFKNGNHKEQIEKYQSALFDATPPLSSVVSIKLTTKNTNRE